MALGGNDVLALIERTGRFSPGTVRQDLSGRDRIVMAELA